MLPREVNTLTHRHGGQVPSAQDRLNVEEKDESNAVLISTSPADELKIIHVL